MPTGKIIKSIVERLPPNEWLWDTGVKGFGARRQNDGVFYYLRYRLGGRQRMRSIGRHGSPWTPDTARREAQQALGEVAKGLDPFAPRVRVGETFGVEVARFLDRKRGALRPRTFAEVKRHLTTQAGPLVRLRLAEIDRRTIAARLAEIERDSGPFARNRMRSSLATFFAWCISEGFLEPPGPVAGTDKATEGSRDRVLTDPELAAIWRALGPGDYGDIVRLLILTGQRREEIGPCVGVRSISIGASLCCLHREPRTTASTRCPWRRWRGVSSRREVEATALCSAATVRADGVCGRPRSIGAWWTRTLGVSTTSGAPAPPAWPSLAFRRTSSRPCSITSGHKGGVAGIYNRARYVDEMRAALERWGEHVAALVG